jgi:hypothetical protein
MANYIVRKKGRTVARARTVSAAKSKAIALAKRRGPRKNHFFIAKVRKGRKHLLWVCNPEGCSKVKAYGAVVP